MAAQGRGLLVGYHEGNYNGEILLDSLVKSSKKGLWKYETSWTYRRGIFVGVKIEWNASSSAFSF